MPFFSSIEKNLEYAKKQLAKYEEKCEKARTKGTAEMYRGICIRLDERIKVYKEILKGE